MPDRRLPRLRKLLTHPITTASAVFAVVGGVLNVPVISTLWSVAWANLGTLFTAISVPAFTIAPRLDWLPARPLSIAALVVGALFALKKLSNIAGDLRTKLTELRQ